MGLKRKIMRMNDIFLFCIPVSIYNNFYKNHNFLYYRVDGDVITFSPRPSVEMRKRRIIYKVPRNFVSLPKSFAKKFGITKDNYIIWEENKGAFEGEVFQRQNGFYSKIFTIRLLI